MKTGSKQSRRFPGVLLLMGGFGVMGGGLLAPALPALAGAFDVSEHAVGLVLGVYTLAAALWLPFIGFFIDILGRKTTGITCLLIDGFFGLLCPLAPTFTVLLILRFFQGLGIAGLIPVAMTVISDWYGGEERLRAMGHLSGTISLFAVIVPFTGGLLAGFNWRYPFFVYGLSLLLAILFFALIPESGVKTKRCNIAGLAWKHLKSQLSILQAPGVQRVFHQCLMLYFLLYALVTFLPIYLASTYAVYALGAGLALSLQAVIGAIVSTRSVAISRLLPGRAHATAGFLLLAAAMISMPLWPGRYLVGISLVLFGMGFGILQPSVYNEAATAGPERLKGSVLCLFNAVKFAGMTLAPVLLRFVQQFCGLQCVFYIAGLLALFWTLRWPMGGGKRPGRWRYEKRTSPDIS